MGFLKCTMESPGELPKNCYLGPIPRECFNWFGILKALQANKNEPGCDSLREHWIWLGIPAPPLSSSVSVGKRLPQPQFPYLKARIQQLAPL